MKRRQSTTIFTSGFWSGFGSSNLSITGFLEWWRDLLVNLTTVSGLAHILSILCFVVQVVCLDMFLVTYMNSKIVLITLVADIPLLLHLIWFWRLESATRAAPTQWLMFSWVNAAKVVVLFCRVMPRLPSSTGNVDNSGGPINLDLSTYVDSNKLYTPSVLVTLLLITPVFYTLLMLRISVAIFGTSFSKKVTVDLLMHYDMLWHVVIDMVDQVDMFRYSRVAESLPSSSVNQNQTSLVNMTAVVPVLLFLSMAMQAQSLPGVVVDTWNIPEKPCPDSDDDDMLEPIEPHATSLQRGEPATLRERSGYSAWSTTGPQAQSPSLQLPMGASQVTFTREPPAGAGIGGLLPLPFSEQASAGARAEVLAAPPHPETSIRPPGEPPPAPLPPPLQNLQHAQRLNLAPGTGPVVRLSTRHTVASSRPRPSLLELGERSAVSASKARDQVLRLEKQRRRRLQVVVQLIQRQSIIIARKRSAITSIFFTDVPFLIVRLWLWVVLGQTYFPGLGVKNAICIVLNVMQYTVVAVASRDSVREITKQMSWYVLDLMRLAGRFSEDGVEANQASSPAARAEGQRLSLSSFDAAGTSGTPQRAAEDSPHPNPGARAAATWKLLAYAEQNVSRKSIRSTSICVHFWALLIALCAGVLVGKGEGFITSLFKWLQDPNHQAL